MVKNILMGCCVFAIAGTAFAQGKTAAPKAGTEKAMPKAGAEKAAMPANMPGPMSRKVMHESEDKKGVDALYKQLEAGFKKGDMNAVAEVIDFPVLMITDNSKGEFMYTTMDKDTWVKNMSQSMGSMPKNAKMSSKHTAHFLSDSLASVDEQISMSMGKMHGNWNAAELVINKDGKWLVKQMAEAGWGDAMGGGEHAAAPAPTGATTAGK